MTHIEAMKQALEALEEVQEFMNTSDWFNEKVTSLRQAITTEESSATQEPVYQYQLASGAWIDQTKESHDYNVRLGQATVRVVYTHPQPKAEQIDAEWLARRTEASFEAGRQQGMKQERALWELARIGQEIEAEQEPKREPLTKKQRQSIIESLEYEYSHHELIDAVEAFHGITKGQA